MPKPGRAFSTRVNRLLKTPSRPEALTERGPAVPSVESVPRTSPSFWPTTLCAKPYPPPSAWPTKAASLFLKITRVAGAPPHVPFQVPDRSGQPWGTGGGGGGCWAPVAPAERATSSAAIESFRRRIFMVTSCKGVSLRPCGRGERI